MRKQFYFITMKHKEYKSIRESQIAAVIALAMFRIRNIPALFDKLNLNNVISELLAFAIVIAFGRTEQRKHRK